MAQKVVSVKLQAQVEGFTAGMRRAKASADDLTKASAKFDKQDAFGNMAGKAAIAGVGVATAVGVAVKRFADFDVAMSGVAANSGATGTALNALRDAAIEMGAASQFSAKEAADGINELAKAGVATQDILNGGLKGALDLAAAGQIGVAQAAETTASALNQFGLEGSKSVHVADLLSNAANAAQGGVGDMGAALAQAGVAANAAGLNIDETTTILALFAKAGMTGSDAGTSLKTMMQRLSAPTGKAAAEMDRLGIAAYDANGNFIGAEAVMQQLADATSTMSTEARSAAFNVIFGADAIRAASIAADAGAAGYAAMSAEVTKAGGAARTAAALTDNLKGDVERLGGALDSVFIQTGSGANGSLRTLTQGLTGLVEKIAQVPGPILLAGGALTSFALLAPKGIIAYRNYVAQLDSLGISMSKISAKAPKTGAALSGLAKTAGAVAGALTALSVANAAFADGLEELGTERLITGLTEVDAGLAEVNKRFAETSRVSTALGEAETGVRSVGDALRYAFDPGVNSNIENFAGSIGSVFGIENTSQIATAKTRLSELDAALSQLVQSGSTDVAAKQFDAISAAAQQQGISVDELKAKFPQYAEALAAAGNAAVASSGKSGVMADATEDLQSAADDAEKALEALKDAIEGLGSPVAAQRAAAREYEAAIDAASAALKENGRTLDDSTAKGRANQEALDAIRAATLEKVSADYELNESTKGTAAATAIATATMQRGRDAFVSAAIAAGKTKAEAEALATELGLIPDQVAIAVTQSGAAQAGEAIDAAARDRNATIWVNQRPGRRLSDTASEWQGTGGMATGGAVRGPGTGTSDSILTRLSNGEHVLTAAEVSKLGGQSAVYALRAAIRQGRIPKYAVGGAVMSTSRFAPPAMYGSGGPSSITETNDNSIHGVTVYPRDFDDFLRQMDARRRMAALDGRG